MLELYTPRRWHDDQGSCDVGVIAWVGILRPSCHLEMLLSISLMSAGTSRPRALLRERCLSEMGASDAVSIRGRQLRKEIYKH